MSLTFPLSVVGACVQALANKEKWRNCEFAHTSTQYMQEHEGVPSGSDWPLTMKHVQIMLATKIRMAPQELFVTRE